MTPTASAARVFWVFAAALVWPSSTAFAQEAPPGALGCSGCHRPVGGAVPPLNGRPAAEIVEALIAFRGGAREATIMDRIAKGFSAEEERALAAWFADQPAGRTP